MNLIERVHGNFVHRYRVRVLSAHLAALMPPQMRVLDVGCGDGLLASVVAAQRPDVELRGIDVLVREATRVPVEAFDGEHIPFPDGSWDVVMFIDVLHHAREPLALLREGNRVAAHAILIKDHICDGRVAKATLSFMDWVGNARYGIALPNRYWSSAEWKRAFAEVGLTVTSWSANLGLYPFPANLVFERSLHFVAGLRRSES